MFNLTLLAWVLGIATMGKSYPGLLLILPVLLICALVLALLTQFKRFQSHSILFKSIQAIIFSGSAFALGHQYADHSLNERLQLRETRSEQVEVVVYVHALNQLADNNIQQKVQVLGRHPAVVDWLLYLKSKPQLPLQDLQLGHYYRVSGQLKPAHSYATAGAFDQEKWWLQQGIMAAVRVETVQSLSPAEVSQLGFDQHVQQQQGWWSTIRLSMEKMRLRYREFLQRQPVQQKGLLLGLLTGDTSLLSEPTKEQFQRLGISHLLAISGPHVLIFAALVSWGLQRVIRHYRPHWYLTVPKPYLLLGPFCACVLLYCAFVGFEIPALRTLLMSLIAAVLILLQQPLRALNLLVLSASILLCFDPWSILSAAFWLSFGACFILLRIYQTIQLQKFLAEFSWRQQLYQALQLLIESQGKIFIALIPLVLIFFQQLSWIAPLANILAIPLLAGLIVPLDILSACLYLIFEPLAALGFQMTDLLLNVLMTLLAMLESVFEPQLYSFAWTPWMIVVVGVGIAILFLPRGVVPKYWAVLAIIPVLFAAMPAPRFALHVLDVGQGQAILLQDDQHTLMIDTGGYYNEAKFSIGKRVVVPYLLNHGVAELDQLFLSHLDQDHSGALPVIAQEIEIQHFLANEKPPQGDARNFQYCHAGQHWQFTHSKLSVLAPESSALNNVKNNRNEHSCVFYLQVAQAGKMKNFLIMGDAGWETEYQLLQRYPDLQVDVLLLGHHGSRHSSSYGFLQKIKPKLVIASAGFENRYGHPSPLVQARLQELGIPLISTVQAGTLQFDLQKDGVMKLQMHRQQWRWLHRPFAADIALAAGS